MYTSPRSHQGSALIIGLVIVVLLTILTTSFLEKILNLGKTSGGIDNSAQSYTLATGLIEEQLMDGSMTKREPWKISTRSEGSTTATGRNLSAYTGGTILPDLGKGNSPFDPDWNIIGMGDPVQIVIPEGLGNWSGVKFYFRVPNIDGLAYSGAASSISSSGIILWTFGYSGASLYASGETQIFTGLDITGDGKGIAGKEGKTNTGSGFSFAGFYGDSTSGVGTDGARCANYNCTLKLSMIRPFVTIGGQSFSSLEYKIEFGVTVPSQYMIIDSSAYVHGYLRSRQIRIPQITSNTATDFAVLQ